MRADRKKKTAFALWRREEPLQVDNSSHAHALSELARRPLPVAVAVDRTGLHAYTVWERPSAGRGRERVLGVREPAAPPTSSAPVAGPLAVGPCGVLAFGTRHAGGPALCVHAPGNAPSWYPVPEPIRAVAWVQADPIVLLDLQPGVSPSDRHRVPAPGDVCVRTWARLPVRDWDSWYTEAQPTVIRLEGGRWRTVWRGSTGDRVVAIAGHPDRDQVVLHHRTRGSDAQDHDTLSTVGPEGWEPLPVPDRSMIDGITSSSWGLAWTCHTRTGSGFGGPRAVRMQWGRPPQPLGHDETPWQRLHGIIGTSGDLLVTIARDGEQILQRVDPRGTTDLATGVIAAAAHDHGWWGIHGRIGTWPTVSHGAGAATPSPRRHPVVRRTSRTADGTRTSSWLVHAKGGTERPTLLWIHGGPLSQWADVWHPRWCPGVFVDAGYTVLMPNPRGSLGRGARFRDAVGGNRWGEGPIDDLLRAVEEAGEHPAVDPTRVAVMGASWGGWAAAWLAGTTTRFRCAVAHAAPSSLPALHGDTDVPGFLESHLGVAPGADTPEDRWSTVRKARHWSTPTLITHGEQDMRVPVGQAIALFQALRRQGHPAWLRTYPKGHHWLTRAADVEDWHAASLEFLDRHLREPCSP